MAFELLSIGVTQIDPDLLEQAAGIALRQWPQRVPIDPVDEAERRISDAQAYDGPEEKRPMVHVVIESGTAIAVATTLERVIGTEVGQMSILALSGVVVEPDRRGEGLGKAVVQAAFNRVDQGVFGFSLYQTEPKNLGFYEGLGARQVHNEIVNSLETPDMNMPVFNPGELVIVYPDKPGWPEGTIDLLGPGY